MPDQSIAAFWLLLSGLVAVSIALGVVGTALFRLRSDSAARIILSRNAAVRPGDGAADALSKDDIIAILRDELLVFQAVYRADLAKVLAEKHMGDAPAVTTCLQNGVERLDHAIALARAGHNVENIVQACDLDPADAAALVRFNGPQRAFVPSSQL